MTIDHDALERLRRLRSLGVKRGARDLQPSRTESMPASRDATDGHLHGDQLPGEPADTPFGPAWVRTARYPLAAHPRISAFLGTAPGPLAALGRDPALQALDPARTAFIDTETTGLSLGAGTYTFLIGIGSYETDGDKGCFVVRQYFMRDPGEERAQLHLVEERLARCTGIISFNGRAFDLPLLQGRFTLAYMPPPLPGAPHLDLLPAARRIYRAHLGSCSLGDLERRVLNVRRTAADVPGWMIPGIYRDFYREPGRPETVALIARVFYHNMEDILSMARLAAEMVPFFELTGLADRLVNSHPLQCASLARCYDALGWAEASEQAYRMALAGHLPPADQADLLRDLALMLKRAGRRHDAAVVWETWITSMEATDVTPYIELAKHHEWFTGDLAAARGWTGWAIRMVGAQRPDPGRQVLHAELARQLARRLARLERKMDGNEDKGEIQEDE